MKNKWTTLLAVLVIIWSIWGYYDRSPEWHATEPGIDVTEAVTSDSLCGRNVVGIQPYMVPADYLTGRHFYEKMRSYFEKARSAGYFRGNTVVLLPEYLGTWLVIANEKEGVANAKTVTGAMALIVASNPLKLLRQVFNSNGESDRMAAAIFRMKARSMADLYGSTFIRLAREYGVTINAGSIVLPGPKVEKNTILADLEGPLYNTTFIFHPIGAIDGQIVRKSFPISSELPFVKACPIEELSVYELPVGRTALLVCADSWYPSSYERIASLGAEVVLVNSYLAGDRALKRPWGGYDGGVMPDDVDPTQIGNMTEQEAWVSHALPGRIRASGARVGVNVFLRGNLWDLGTDGQPFFVMDGKLLPVTPSDKGGIWNLCF